jgi:hypothetical protein|tara:strand:- start:2717 stop:3271 length:555 start_codon:yes stop_codon:yes gene_type:complete
MNTKVILEKDNKEKVTNKEMIEVSELVATIQDTQDQLDEIEENLKAKKEVYRRLTEDDLPTKFASMNISKMEMENGDKIEVKPIYRGHISKKNQDQAYKWLRQNNHADLIKNEVTSVFGKGEDALAINIKKYLNESGISFTDRESVHPRTLGTFIREQTEKGKVLPHDLLGIYIGQTTKIKRGE